MFTQPNTPVQFKYLHLLSNDGACLDYQRKQYNNADTFSKTQHAVIMLLSCAQLCWRHNIACSAKGLMNDTTSMRHRSRKRWCHVQGVFTSLYGGVGGGLGGLFGGLVYGAYGAAAVFQIGLVVMLVGWVLCTICQIVAACVCQQPQPGNSV